MHFDEQFLRGTLSEVTVVQDFFVKDATFCIDTRKLQPGEIFVALKGAQGDGHQFLEQALKKGASGLLLSSQKKDIFNTIDKKLLDGKLVVMVPDVLQAFVKLASAWRSQFTYPVIAITGSVGKTSTKQVIATILSHHGGNFLVSKGNENTCIGLARNMLAMREDHEASVFEVGINKRGEMDRLAKMLKPTTALITGIGHCHMEGLGSLQDIALEKRDIFKYFSEDSIGIINGDQTILSGVGYTHPVIKFGSKTTNQVQARKIRVNDTYIDFVLKIYKKKYAVRLQKPHEGAVFNALGAVVIAHYLSIPDEIIIKGIESNESVESRFEQKQLKDGKGLIIDDCYNANPESMKAALLAFEKINTSAQKIAVLGDMLELGVNSPFWHRQLGRFLRKVPSLKKVILVGDLVEWTQKTIPLGVKAEIVPTWEDAITKLQNKLEQDNVVLVKASRGIKLDKLVKHFVNQ
ncbi:UDP-N-acetylmuramoyl-tripeptide--D-alanyl-D-alanine ligase [bacterium]|nr:UDP-N-acetylmuramoyl-tripeptide--D-alanyl-D-alanine ligase [bacterium]